MKMTVTMETEKPLMSKLTQLFKKAPTEQPLTPEQNRLSWNNFTATLTSRTLTLLILSATLISALLIITGVASELVSRIGA